MEGVVSKAFNKEGMLVGVGSYIGRTEVILCFGWAHDLFRNNVLGSEASTPGSRFGPMVFGEMCGNLTRQWKGALTWPGMIGPIGLKKELVRLKHSSKLEVEAFGSGQMDEGADLQSDRVI